MTGFSLPGLMEQIHLPARPLVETLVAGKAALTTPTTTEGQHSCHITPAGRSPAATDMRVLADRVLVGP